MAFPDYINSTEAKIIQGIIDRALARNYLVSVFDGLQFALHGSSDIEAITAEVHATDVTELIFHTADKQRLGGILLIHGNHEDVVSDCTDTPRILELCS
ncbi:hypothetical protein C3Y94_026025 [Rhizobium ruizarguesonis]|uniref:hypothetical protein n=1 Tax=Rhizobium ruizarguesonis TaxID=2081791 RepID=UPI00163A0DED|nr:hypothetical protein [Rhizobium ruizarguesonis]MBC2806613.1 hypothetical protein [Rhizobium ruizarguesonis]